MDKPVYEETDGWYFWDDAKGDKVGPWISEAKAEQMKGYHYKFVTDLDMVTRTY